MTRKMMMIEDDDDDDDEDCGGDIGGDENDDDEIILIINTNCTARLMYCRNNVFMLFCSGKRFVSSAIRTCFNQLGFQGIDFVIDLHTRSVKLCFTPLYNKARKPDLAI